MNAVLLALLVSTSQSPTPPKVAEVAVLPAAKPEEFTSSVGKLKRIRSEDAKARWEMAAGTTGAEIITDDKGGLAFVAEKPGRYTLICYTSGPATWVVITVGGDSPTPPAPPKPVDPPKPTPGIVKRIAEAVEKDGGLNDPNRQALTAIQVLVGEAKEYAGKEEIKTANEFVGVIAKASSTLSKDAIPATRQLLIAELKTLLGDSDFELNSDKRDEIRQSLGQLESAITEVLK